MGQEAKTKNIRILFAGESWITHSVHAKGFSAYDTASYAEGLDPLRDALIKCGFDFTYVRNHEAANHFPSTADEIAKFDIVILSDIPADTLLLHEDTFIHGKRTPNRLSLIADFVGKGGGFLMVGGYMSFSGFQGKANYHFSPLSKILPVKLFGFDDRVEIPEGATPIYLQADHPILSGIPAEWPHFLGYNKLLPGDGDVLMSCQEDPFLSVRKVGQGRVAAFASDCSPHWAPPEFVAWEYYPKFWEQLILWLAARLE
jgi:uncharacterized membrane protein